MVSKRHFLIASGSIAALLTLAASGCATDETARATAQEALDKAERAQACCDANQERVDRMYQKIMSK